MLEPMVYFLAIFGAVFIVLLGFSILHVAYEKYLADTIIGQIFLCAKSNPSSWIAPLCDTIYFVLVQIVFLAIMGKPGTFYLYLTSLCTFTICIQTLFDFPLLLTWKGFAQYGISLMGLIIAVTLLQISGEIEVILGVSALMAIECVVQVAFHFIKRHLDHNAQVQMNTLLLVVLLGVSTIFPHLHGGCGPMLPLQFALMACSLLSVLRVLFIIVDIIGTPQIKRQADLPSTTSWKPEENKSCYQPQAQKLCEVLNAAIKEEEALRATCFQSSFQE